MAIGDDLSIAANGDIRVVGGSTNYTVLQLHRWLMDLADDPESAGNDLLDITVATPSERSTDNIITLNAPFNVDDAAAERFYDGSITQLGGATIYAGLVVVGAVETSTELVVVQDDAIYTSFWGTGINADAANNILTRMLIKVRDQGADLDARKLRVQARELSDTYAEFLLTAGLGNNTAAIFTSDDLNNQTAAGTIATWTEITNTEGFQEIDISGAGAAGQEYFSKWDLGIRTAPNLFERTKWIGRRGTAETIHSRNGELFRGITHEVPYTVEAGGPFVEDEVLAWGTIFAYDNELLGPFTEGQYLAFGTSGAIAQLLYLDDQGVTGVMVVAVEPGTGTIVDGEQITELDGGTATADVDGITRLEDTGAVGGRGLLLALDDNGVTGELYIQLLSGSPPVTGLPITGLTSNAECDSGVPVARTVSPEFLGSYTGSSIIGAYGQGMTPADTIAADQFTPLDGTPINPPNNVTFTLFGLVSGEDRVLVVNNSAGAPDFSQMTLDVALTGAAETQADVNAIPADTPASGVIRITTDDGLVKYVPYTSYAGSIFTFTAAEDFTAPSDASISNGVMVAYLDKLAAATQEAFTTVYDADRTLFIRVRDGGTAGDTEGIKTFETTSVLGDAGGSATAIRISDV